VSGVADFYPAVLAVAVAVLVLVSWSPLAERIGIPASALFLALGIVAGVSRPGLFHAISDQTLQRTAALLLYLVLFHGGLETGLADARRTLRPILVLGLPGTALMAGLLAGAAHFVLGLEWMIATPLGVALAPTDPTAVYSALRGRAEAGAPRGILEGESGFNDPVGITLQTVAVLILAGGSTTYADGVLRFAEELGIGIGAGVLGGFLLLRARPLLVGIEPALRPAAVLAAAIAIGAATASLHGSGFLAVYLCGLIASSTWRERGSVETRAVPAALALAAEPILFGLLGGSYASLVAGADIAYGIAIGLAAALVARPIVVAICLVGSGLRRPERTLVAWGGLKGAVPLLLAGFPALEGLDGADRVKAIVLVATAVSVLVQGSTLGLFARRAA
jgi:cell volume regulation protein A